MLNPEDLRGIHWSILLKFVKFAKTLEDSNLKGLYGVEQWTLKVMVLLKSCFHFLH